MVPHDTQLMFEKARDKLQHIKHDMWALSHRVRWHLLKKLLVVLRRSTILAMRHLVMDQAIHQNNGWNLNSESGFALNSLNSSSLTERAKRSDFHYAKDQRDLIRSQRASSPKQ